MRVVEVSGSGTGIGIEAAERPGGPGRTWIPFSQIRAEGLGTGHFVKEARGNLVISLWLAEQRGWVRRYAQLRKAGEATGQIQG